MNRIATIILAIIVCGCTTDQLDGEYNDFEGRWYWIETTATDPGDNSTISIIRDQTDYYVQIELTANGRILFYRNGFVISDNRFTLENNNGNSSAKRITIEVKGETTGDIALPNNRLTLTLSNDSLNANAYPFPALDDLSIYAEGVELEGNYFYRE